MKELTILMPCLNEAETLEVCIKKAQTFLMEHGVDGEVLIADNGSTDGSREIATECGARVVPVAERGYGAALIGGCNAADSQYIIMGDADDSYDFLHLMPFLEKLRDGYDLVMGNRFKGGISKGAMPPLHRYLGNPLLSFIGRLFYPSQIKDFHCGLRGYNREAILELDLQTTGMEYASEMVVKATLSELKMAEVPTTLSPDGRSRPPHLRSFRDGWRHLKFLLMHSPKWLFFYPGIILFVVGILIQAVLCAGPFKIGNVTFDINTMLFGSAFSILGGLLILFSMLSTTYARNSGFIPVKSKLSKGLLGFTVDRGMFIGAIVFIAGIVAAIIALSKWGRDSFGNLDPQVSMRLTIPSITAMVLGMELMFGGFMIGILNIRHK